MKGLLRSFILVAGLTACTTLGPDHVTPDSEVEAQWLASDDPVFQAGKEINSDWWTQFNDPVLDRLVQMAYEQNLSLQAAGLRIMQALKWSEDKDNLERLTVGSMAKWTLASHAANNKHLLDFCRAELAHQPKATARVLREVVAAAETFETGKIRKQAVAAINELKTKGPATRRKWSWWGKAGQMALSVGCVAAAATGQVYLGLPCVIGGAASSAALKLWEAQEK